MNATKTRIRLTLNQRIMLEELQSEGPFTYSEMRRRFGRQWKRTFRRLDRKHAGVEFVVEPREAKHYAATKGGA